MCYKKVRVRLYFLLMKKIPLRRFHLIDFFPKNSGSKVLKNFLPHLKGWLKHKEDNVRGDGWKVESTEKNSSYVKRKRRVPAAYVEEEKEDTERNAIEAQKRPKKALNRGKKKRREA